MKKPIKAPLPCKKVGLGHWKVPGGCDCGRVWDKGLEAAEFLSLTDWSWGQVVEMWDGEQERGDSREWRQKPMRQIEQGTILGAMGLEGKECLKTGMSDVQCKVVFCTANIFPYFLFS